MVTVQTKTFGQKILKWLRSQRTRRAAVCALAGWVVSFVMVHWGGPMSRFIPNDGAHIAAFVGAFVSGYLLANGFGRAGVCGWVLAVVCAIVATVLGAVIAGSALAVAASAGPSIGVSHGLIAIVDAAFSPWCWIIWIIAMVGVDAHARWVETTPMPSLRSIFR